MPACERGNQVELGRWLSPDALGGDVTNPQSLNRYAYALNNPTTFVDPLGLETINYGSTGPPPCETQSGPLSPMTSCYTQFGIQAGTLPSPNMPDEFDLLFPQHVSSEGNLITVLDPNGQAVLNTFQNQTDNFCWWCTFASNFFSPKSLSTAWKSLTSDNGCNNLLFGTFAGDISPFPTGPSLSDAIEPASKVVSAVAFNKALSYAAGQPNVLGGIGLLYPQKSRVFQGLMHLSAAAEDAVLPATVVVATGHAVLSDVVAAAQGECQ